MCVRGMTRVNIETRFVQQKSTMKTFAVTVTVELMSTAEANVTTSTEAHVIAAVESCKNE